MRARYASTASARPSLSRSSAILSPNDGRGWERNQARARTMEPAQGGHLVDDLDGVAQPLPSLRRGGAVAPGDRIPRQPGGAGQLGLGHMQPIGEPTGLDGTGLRQQRGQVLSGSRQGMPLRLTRLLGKRCGILDRSQVQYAKRQPARQRQSLIPTGPEGFNSSQTSLSSGGIGRGWREAPSAGRKLVAST